MILFQKKQRFVDQRYFLKQKEEECTSTQKEVSHKTVISRQCHQLIKLSQSQDLNLFEFSSLSNDLYSRLFICLR